MLGPLDLLFLARKMTILGKDVGRGLTLGPQRLNRNTPYIDLMNLIRCSSMALRMNDGGDL